MKEDKKNEKDRSHLISGRVYYLKILKETTQRGFKRRLSRQGIMKSKRDSYRSQNT